ncbi:MAG: hypothetical protein ACJ72Q_01690 [Nitrososphaeraceae archaeon]
MNDEERDKKLEDIHNNNKKELDDFMNRESAKLRSFYNDAFNEEINQYEESMKEGNYFNATLHFDAANSINEYLKTLNKVGL